jgi:hypothetical protein
MRIALVAPLAEAVPPKLYGGTERVVSWLAEELVCQRHEVTLFASGGSKTGADLVVSAPQSLRLAGVRDHVGSTLCMLREVRRRADEFDVIHFHVDLLPQALFHDLAYKCLITLHGRLDQPDTLPLYQAYPEMPLVSVSDAQRLPMPPPNVMRAASAISKQATTTAEIFAFGFAPEFSGEIFLAASTCA